MGNEASCGSQNAPYSPSPPIDFKNCLHAAHKNTVCALSNIRDTSFKHPISGQSTLMVKGCIDIILAVFSTGFLLNTILVLRWFGHQRIPR